MIRFNIDFDSNILMTREKLIVLIPHKMNFVEPICDFQKYYYQEPHKVLLLLHGAWDSGESWILNTRLSEFVDQNNIAVILPSVGNTFYKKKLDGEDYFSYVTEEILGFVRGMLPISLKREDTFVGGNSMGGYGAMKMAFQRPDLFGKAFSLSGALEIQESGRLLKKVGLKMDGVFENVRQLKGSKDDLLVMMEKAVRKKAQIPELYQAVGTQDYLYHANQWFKESAENLGLSITYEEASGDHDWDFWNSYVNKAIQWCLK